MKAHVLVLVAGCLLLTCRVEGKRRRNGYVKAIVPPQEQYYNHLPPPPLDKSKIPANYNWCSVDGEDYCVPNWNQHIPYYCGSCWVHATLSTIQDRLKIAKKGKGPDIMLSRQTLLNCGWFHKNGDGCNGGDPIDVFRFMKDYGLPDEGCLTYNATDHTKFENYESLKRCPPEGRCVNCMSDDETGEDVCWAVLKPIKYYLTRFGKVGPTEDDMISEIYQRGPIVCSCATPDDLIYDYTGEIYVEKNKTAVEDVDHNIEVVGWGEEKGMKYWVIRNSWGSYWGKLGFFRLQRGVNALRIEDGDCWYAEPEFTMEKDVKRGKLLGSMYGVYPNPDWKEPSSSASLVLGRKDAVSTLLQNNS